MGDVGVEPLVLEVIIIAGAGDVALIHAVGGFTLVKGLNDELLEHGGHIDRFVQCRWRGGQSRMGKVGVEGVSEGGVLLLEADGHFSEII